ncbi:glycine-rich protein 5-like [Eucalyptus grandis]|uniref:Glycine-rich protein n=1 Tax=Eucalyptus globulus TaxID=34317 RepID=A0ABD3ISW4_EUCGL|nr:glycine-rich protein 5-like [Eucalyptus grandis]
METFVIVWIAVCSTISVLIVIVAVLNAIFAIRMRGRILGDGNFGGGDGGATKHDALSSHLGVLDGGASLECGGDMIGVVDFGGGSLISGADGGVIGCGDTGGGGGGGGGSSGDGGGGCGS